MAHFIRGSTRRNVLPDLHVGQGGSGAVDSELSWWVQVWEQQLGLVRVEAWLYGQYGADLFPREGTALQDCFHQQVGHGHAEHTGLLVGHWLQGHGTCVEAWGKNSQWWFKIHYWCVRLGTRNVTQFTITCSHISTAEGLRRVITALYTHSGWVPSEISQQLGWSPKPQTQLEQCLQATGTLLSSIHHLDTFYSAC